MKINRRLLVGAAVATVAAGSLGGVGMAATATTSSTKSDTSIVDKIASKFNLNKSDVQAVFDADRQEHQAAREAEQKQQLADAVTAGKLTQAQADHITSVLNEIKSLHGTTTPDKLSDDVRAQIKQKMDDLRTWAQTNNVRMNYVMLGHGGHGGQRGMGGPDDAPAN